MKKAILLGLFFISAGVALGQTNGSYRSRQTGNWNQATTWQVFNAGWNNVEDPGAGIYQNLIPSSVSSIITISSNTTVTIPSGVEIFADQIEFGTTAPMPTLQVASGGILNILNGSGHDIRFFNNGVSFSQFIVSGLVRLQNNATMVNDNYAGTVIAASNATTVNTYKVLNGGAQVHNSTDGLPYADWQTGSTFVFYATKTSPMIADVSIQFYNFTWEGAIQSLNLTLGGRLRNVEGNFRVNNTNGRILYLGTANTYTLNVGGDFTVLGNSRVILNNNGNATINVGSIAVPGDLQILSGNVDCSSTGTTTINVFGNYEMSGVSMSMRTATGGSSATNLNVRGNFTQDSGTITRSASGGSANINFTGSGTTSIFSKNGGSIINAINFTVPNGKILDLGTSALEGSGALTLFNGSTTHVRSLDADGAIQNNTTAGNIQVGGTRTYQSGSTIIYDGAAAQFIGAGHPSTSNTVFNNLNNVTLASDVTINGSITLTAGFLLINDNTLTLGGAYTRTGGTLAASTQSNLTINGSGNFADLVIAFSEFPNNPINNLTINRTGGTVFLGTNLIVAGTFTQSNGNFSLGAFNPFTLTIRGPFIQTAGSFLVFNSSSLVVDGAGALPADVNIIGPNLNTLTMNRVGGTFVSTSALTITNLNLFNGVINNSTFNITMAPNGIVTRESGGSLTQVLGVDPNSYDLIYNVATDVTSGPELPFTSPVTTRLGNLTKRGIATVNLTHDIVVNGTFFIEQGTFDVGINNDVTINRNLTVNGIFETQQGLVTFGGSSDQTISSLSPLTFYDVVVNQSVASAVDITIGVDIENSLTVSSASTVNAGNQLLRLISNATSTAYVGPSAAGASITGTVIAERHLPNTNSVRQYHHIAVPVSGTTVADWKDELTITGTFSDPATGPGIISDNPSMFYWLETNVSGGSNRYAAYPSSGPSSAAPIVLGRGYSVFGRSQGAIDFDSRGTLGQGAVPLAVTNSGGIDAGWNLLGNPYPAPLDWDAVAAALPGAVDNAIYFTDTHGNYPGSGGNVSYINGVGVPASYQGIIASGQAFFVHTNGNATITFQESHKFTGQTQFIREAQIANLLRITVKTSTTSDEVALRLHEEATNGYDEKFDAFKFLKSPELSLSMSIETGEKLVINSVSSLSCGTRIPLTIETANKGNHTLDFVGIETFDGGKMIRLNDKLLGKLIDIRTSPRYDFSITEAASITDRFEIIIGTPSADELDVENGVVCKPGTVLLKVKNPVALRYNWYENIGDSSPIKGATTSEFLTPSLAKSKTYYVASVSSTGCEGSRIPVKAEVMSAEPATIAQKGSLLVSNYAEGNQWYLNGIKLENENSNTLKIATSGTYSLEVSTLACKNVALLEVNLGEENIGDRLSVVVYPNPTADKVNIEVKSDNVGTTAKLVSPVGLELGQVELKGVDGIHYGEFDLISYPSGIYMIQIKDGGKLFIKKVSKFK